ncbi:UDP-glucose 4-epimerase GalE [Phaeacidiphilus oryzae]|uniref:UDP-glucose 4-epimerase GalE n=1 Tax=Phaeacidiphilus oryzae TaxID=348818 RepID=UPI00055A1368|nr:UDP-glucose 4-epimerase GalE [Phaeacidiphilus oryzae]
MTWLITGGAGYIGAHVVRALLEDGKRVVVLDDLSTGSADRLPAEVPLVTGSTLDGALVESAMREHGVTGVLHIAAKKQVGESVEQPLRYYHENVEGLRVVLAAAAATGVKSFLLSSSAAVYGMPDVELVTEETPCVPMSPYGETKRVGEWLVAATGRAHGMGTVSLRYFNVAGAATAELGDPAILNLVPMVFERLTKGQQPLVFGDDYPTPDGTCIRDYIHVADVASAHAAAVRRLESEGGEKTELVLNIGRGEGVSVRGILDVIGEVTGRDASGEVVARRPGDPARIVASAEAISKELGWEARYDVREMIGSAWAGWCLRHPEARA